MKIQCNVCHESPIVDVVREPNHEEDAICCPACDKLLAYATEEKIFISKLVWRAIDTDYNKVLGMAPVKVISI